MFACKVTVGDFIILSYSKIAIAFRRKYQGDLFAEIAICLRHATRSPFDRNSPLLYS
ncbi:hypothetical protein [Argonema galeatum]|uniref:hypothetical protein n=1 Tax=Argonema galeatum TaxID=2942762 RepID=UPI002013AF00|nr:hypothetical protein [Argonema galeatum]